MIAIIGGGPIGSYAAYLLAKGGKEVALYEACSCVDCQAKGPGVVTGDLDNFHALAKKKQKFVINEYGMVRIYAPNRDKVDIPLKLYLIDREKLTKAILEMAEEENVKIHFSHKFKASKEKGIVLEDISKKAGNKEKEVPTDILIGADGPHSAVAKLLNPKFDVEKKSNHIHSFMATVKVKKDPNTYEVFLCTKDRNFFSWIAPENSEKARIGMLGTDITEKELHEFLEQQNIPKKSILETDTGIIPIFNTSLQLSNVKDEARQKEIYIVGEAATQVQISTGATILPGLKAASLLAEAILNEKEYEKLVKRYIYPDLLRHKIVRKAMNVMNDKDYDYLIHLLKQKRMVKRLSTYRPTDLSRQLFSLLLVEPRLLYFAKMLPVLFREG